MNIQSLLKADRQLKSNSESPMLLLLLLTIILFQQETLCDGEREPDQETIGHFLVTRPRKSDQDLNEDAVRLFRMYTDLREAII